MARKRGTQSKLRPGSVVALEFATPRLWMEFRRLAANYRPKYGAVDEASGLWVVPENVGEFLQAVQAWEGRIVS